MSTKAKTFLALLKMKGHNGDTVCLDTIDEKLKSGVKVAVTHYNKYLATAEVKKLTPLEIKEAVKKGFTIWSSEGLITAEPYTKLPFMNGKILIASDMEKLIKTDLIVIN